MIVLLIAFGILFLMFPLIRLIVFNLHRIGLYSVFDILSYIRFKKWNDFNLYGIDMYIGMFGHGKTLSMTHRAKKIYDKWGDQVRFISNYHLTDIPYTKLINFNQLVDLGEEEDSSYIGTVVLIDEIETLLSHRNFANFPLPLLHLLMQQRKKRVVILCSAQRFFTVDKIFRSITTNVIDCNKYWRFQHMEVYDAWDLENAMNPRMIKRLGNFWWFVRNKDFNSYDTSEMISKSAGEEFISNDEIIVRRGLDSMVNDKAISSSHLSRSYRKQSKK